MKVLEVISTTTLFLLFGATVPALAQEEHHEEGAKPAQHEEQAKPAAKQEQAKPQEQEQQAKPAKQERNRRSSNQAKPQKQEQQAKSQAENQQKHTQQQAKGQQQQETKQQQQQVKTQQNEEKSQQHNNNKPMAKRNNHRANTHGMVRKIGTDTNITKVVLVLTITPALRKTVGATTAHAGSTLTAAIGSMQEHIRHGFTSGTCTSLWDRMGYGMQLHTVTLL